MLWIVTPESVQPDGRLLAAFLIIVAHLHLNPTTRANLNRVGLWLHQRFKDSTKTEEDSARSLRIAEAMSEVRQTNFLFGTTIFVHVAALNLMLLTHDALQRPCLSAAGRVAVLLAVYVIHMSVANGHYRPTPPQVRRMCGALYMLFIAFLLVAPSEASLSVDEKCLMQGWKNVCRLTMGALFIDTQLSLVGQTLISLASIFSGTVLNSSGSDPYMLIGNELQNYMASMLISASIEFLLRSRVQALLDAADAESLLSGVRRMLRGVCDGDLMLTNNLTIHGPGGCLQNLLMNRANLHGRAFEQLLPPDERGRFAAFIAASTAAAAEPADLVTNAPPCLRVSLCGASNTRVGVDIFHVPVPHLFGAEQPYHLLALSEDSESRHAAPPPLQDTVPELRSVPAFDTKSSRSCAASSTSSSSAGSGTSSTWQPTPELEGLMLLVDASTPALDIQQAHFSFDRSPEKAPASEFAPSLRMLCRPTDWESVRRKVEHCVRSVKANTLQKGKALKNICLRMPDDATKFMMAKHVQIAVLPAPGRQAGEAEGEGASSRVSLQFSGFAQAQDTSRRQHPELGGIHEGATCAPPSA